MKAILITFDQAHYHTVVEILEKANCRGFTHWEQVQGRGSVSGEPHYGSHAWPSMASAIISVTEDARVDAVLEKLRAADAEKPRLGLRAFVWNVEKSV